VYRTKYSLKRHYLGHLGIKQYECPHCSKRFSLPQYLEEHIYTHTGDKPFVCQHPGCEKRFRQAGKLSIHKKMHSMPSFKDRMITVLPDIEKSQEIAAAIQAVYSEIALFKLPSFFYSKTLPAPHPVMVLPCPRRHSQGSHGSFTAGSV
jgi:hypothetical protein